MSKESTAEPEEIAPCEDPFNDALRKAAMPSKAPQEFVGCVAEVFRRYDYNDSDSMVFPSQTHTQPHSHPHSQLLDAYFSCL